MLTLLQIKAIIGLLIAFSATQSQVNLVQDILYKANPQVVHTAPAVVPIGGVGGVISSVFVDLKLNGSDGVGSAHIVDVPLNGNTSSKGSFSWNSSGVVFPGCTLSSGNKVLKTHLDPIGNMEFSLANEDVRVSIDCHTQLGTTSDYVFVNATP